MKDLITGDKATVARLAERLKQANSHAQYQRIQCVLIRATLGSSAAEIAQERTLLKPFLSNAEAGGVLTVSEIQRAYAERTGKAVAPSTIYCLLDRHGWRKVAPRPRHPKADVAAQAAFKKNCTAWWVGSSCARLSAPARCA
jgi:transposase